MKLISGTLFFTLTFFTTLIFLPLVTLPLLVAAILGIGLAISKDPTLKNAFIGSIWGISLGLLSGLSGCLIGCAALTA